LEIKEENRRTRMDLDPLVRGMDPDPYQNVTDRQHVFSLSTF
jgi:hypothetical protein